MSSFHDTATEMGCSCIHFIYYYAFYVLLYILSLQICCYYRDTITPKCLQSRKMGYDRINTFDFFTPCAYKTSATVQKFSCFSTSHTACLCQQIFLLWEPQHPAFNQLRVNFFQVKSSRHSQMLLQVKCKGKTKYKSHVHSGCSSCMAAG